VSPGRCWMLGLVALIIAGSARAQLPSAARAEVEALLSGLASSGCEFNRNGTWYDAVTAKAHLLRKLEYLEKKNALHTTEQFISLGASSSSTSGKPYQVRCNNAPAMDSGEWMRGRLRALRGSAPVR
jgi:hypothetical protein